MSRTYIGPFGRILPVDENNPPGPDQQPQRPPSSNDNFSRMTTYQLPRPTNSTGLQFGTDHSPGFTEPTRYDTMSQSRRSGENLRALQREQLPGVSQLLTPRSQTQASVPCSPYSPQYPSDATLVRSDQSSSYRNIQPGRPPQTREGQYDPRYAEPYSHIRGREHMYLGREYSETHQATQHYPSSYPARHQAISPATSYSDPNQHPSYAYQRPSGNAFSTSMHYHHKQHEGYGLTPGSVTDQERSGQEGANIGKPVPRVVGEEGSFWIYEDGTRCKKVIDGEPVNAQWGVTKAGKPRKRLAIACMTCREKKIKCDPGEPKCVQCDKFGRECRFQTALRSHHTHPESPSYDHQAYTPTSMSSRTGSAYPNPHELLPEHQPSVQSPNIKRSLSTESKARTPSPVAPMSPSCMKPALKRRRQESLEASRALTEIGKVEIKIPPPTRKPVRSPTERTEVVEPKTIAQEFGRCKCPYKVNPATTQHYLDLYFAHVNLTTYCMFPRELFWHWLKESCNKSAADAMVIYAMLAVGSQFSKREARNFEGSMFAEIAAAGVQLSFGKFSLQLVQARLLLCLYHFSIGDSSLCWDYCGSAIRAALGLRLNLEDGIADMLQDKITVYDLNRPAFAECCRRTFWSAYLMERLRGDISGSLIIHDEDIFLRLPGAESFYEYQTKAPTPHFNHGFIDPKLCEAEPASLGHMAYLVRIVSIWGDVHAYTSRSAYQAVASYEAGYDRFYLTCHSRLHQWMSGLPTYLLYTPSNTTASLEDGSIGAYISIHILYHTTIMKLTRHIRYTLLPAIHINRNIQEAYHHARQLLEMIQPLSIVDRRTALALPKQQRRVRHFLSNAFMGYAIFDAIDILSAGGTLSPGPFTDILRTMNSGLAVVEQLSQHWDTAKEQRGAIRKRIRELAGSLIGRESLALKAWVFKESMEKPLSNLQDVFYPEKSERVVSGIRVVDALKLDVRRVQDVLVLSDGEFSPLDEEPPTFDE